MIRHGYFILEPVKIFVENPRLCQCYSVSVMEDNDSSVNQTMKGFLFQTVLQPNGREFFCKSNYERVFVS